MSRYVTPSKITLLMLTWLHFDDLNPTSEETHLLEFLLEHIVAPVQTYVFPDEAGTELEFALPVSIFEADFAHQASSIPGRSMYDLLLSRMWSFGSSYALDSFMDYIACFLTKSREQWIREQLRGDEFENSYGPIVRTSPLGAFIRRCCLEHSRMQYHDSIALWQDFVAYRLPTRRAFERTHPDRAFGLDVTLDRMRLDSSHPLSQIMYGRLVDDGRDRNGGFSAYDVERLMEFQVSELQRLGGRVPVAMKARLDQMSQAGMNVPKMGHYLSFLDAWRAGDHASASDHLHRYFDYALQTRAPAFYQYALLNLAILQADFGSHAEALPAMQEAIAAARENKDTTCLNFCMSWVYHFGRSLPDGSKARGASGILGNEVEGLSFLKSRAKDAEMWGLMGTTLLSEAKLGLQRGDNLSNVWENIAKASHVNITHCAQSIAVPTLLMKSAAYSRVGLWHPAWACYQTFLECHADDETLDPSAVDTSLEDDLKCSCRMAGLFVNQGDYAAARATLTTVPPAILRVWKFQSHLDFYVGLLDARRLLHRNKLDFAEHLLRLLRGQGVPEAEMGVSLSLLDVELLIRRGKFGKALEAVESLALRSFKELNDVSVQTRLLNVKARIMAASGQPVKGFSLVMRAAQIAYRARILPPLWESIGILANILNHRGEFTAAADLLQAIFPQVLEWEDSELTGRLYGILADAYVGLAGRERDQSSKQEELIGGAMESIELARQHFQCLEDVKGQQDMLRKKATILHWRGDLMLANDLATQYLELGSHDFDWGDE